MEPNTFTGVALDRAEDGRRRDGAWVEEQLRHPNARALVAGSSGIPVEDGRLVLRPLPDDPPNRPLLLGIDDKGPVFAVDEDPPPPDATRPQLIGAGGRRGEPGPEQPGRVGLRDAATFLALEEAALASLAAALINWHRGHRFCANCGVATEVVEAGLTRHCARCGVEHHPRVDPVVIMLVTDGERVLLGRQAVWPAGRYSALAGFVSPGESLEEAVTREVLEETGVEIGGPGYVSSQPWPFPASLMVGFEAEWAGGEPDTRDGELEDVRWFSTDDVEAAISVDGDDWETPAGDSPAGLLLPPRAAIARRLIEGWLERQRAG
ncbi:MAG TPA: NAD(+) diphosphatase [Thermoleophilaceae bacterium]